MRHEDLPLETQQILTELLVEHRGKEKRVPEPGDCFFLEAPTLRPMEEPDHALVAAICWEQSALVCSKISLEYDRAAAYDYKLRPQNWTGGYSAMVEVWNSVLYKPNTPLLMHARLGANEIRALKELFLLHQRGQLPPVTFKGVGRPMPEDPEHPLWAFQSREAEVMERVRRRYHEGWDVKVVRLPRRPTKREEEALMAASSSDLASRIRRELESQRQDLEILGPPELPDGSLFLRRDEITSGYTLVWYSAQASPPPETIATPPLEPPAETAPGGVQVVLGGWAEKSMPKEIRLTLWAEGLSRDILIKLPKRGR